MATGVTLVIGAFAQLVVGVARITEPGFVTIHQQSMVAPHARKTGQVILKPKTATAIHAQVSNQYINNWYMNVMPSDLTNF